MSRVEKLPEHTRGEDCYDCGAFEFQSLLFAYLLKKKLYYYLKKTDIDCKTRY